MDAKSGRRMGESQTSSSDEDVFFPALTLQHSTLTYKILDSGQQLQKNVS